MSFALSFLYDHFFAVPRYGGFHCCAQTVVCAWNLGFFVFDDPMRRDMRCFRPWPLFARTDCSHVDENLHAAICAVLHNSSSAYVPELQVGLSS